MTNVTIQLWNDGDLCAEEVVIGKKIGGEVMIEAKDVVQALFGADEPMFMVGDVVYIGKDD